MKKRIVRVCAPVVLISLFACWSAQAQEIRLSASPEVRPYVAALSEVLARAGLQAVTEYFPGERSMQMLEHAKVDAEPFRAAAAVASFADQVRLLGPVGCLELMAFKRASDPKNVTGVKDLKELRVAVPLVGRFSIAFAEKNHLRFEKIMTVESLFNMLERDRFDVAMAPATMSLATIRQLGLEQKIVAASPVLHAEPVYFVLRNERKEWAPRIQAEFDRATASGAWQATIGEVNKSLGIPPASGLSCLKTKR